MKHKPAQTDTLTMSDCIDLKAQFGCHYQVQYEASYAAERGKHRGKHDPWLVIIPCEHGHIYPHGGELLGASTLYRSRVAKRLVALPFVRVVQDGDDGVNLVFPVDHFNEVAAILKPRRRRRLTPVQVSERTERLRSTSFQPRARTMARAVNASFARP